MKNKKPLLTLAIASLALATNSALAADKASTVSDNKFSSSASEGDLTRVSKDRLDTITTARDILGCSVYDGTGEKIGDVKDISLGYKFQSIRRTQIRDNTGNQSSIGESRFGDNTDSQTPNYTENAINEANNEFSGNRQNNRGMTNTSPTPYVFISVGGLLGLGDDVVRVPMSSLSRSDTEKDRLVLQGYSKEKVVAIAELDPRDFDANDYEYDADPNETSRAKRVWTDSFDTTAIREALIAEDGLGKTEADRIIVGRDGENVILTGSVNTQSEKKKAGEIAKEHTTMPVKNDITVNQN